MSLTKIWGVATAYEYAKYGGFDGTIEEFAQGLANYASTTQAATGAEEARRDAEAYAVGTRDGVAVDETDETYENNAKFYVESVQDVAENTINALASFVGAPLVAKTAAEMNNAYRIYVYVGSESGYTYGSWYYYNGTEWTVGGVYNSQALQTDKTLSVENAAADAKTAGDRIGDLEDWADTMADVLDDIAELQALQPTYTQELEVDDEGLVYLLNDGERIAGPYGPFAGGGSGGGSGSDNDAVFTCVKNTEWTSKSITDGTACTVSFTWSSLENDVSTGNGSMVIKVGTNTSTLSIAQGTVAVDLEPYCSTGQNSVSVKIMDIYGNTKTYRFTIKIVDYSISSSFDETVIRSSSFVFTWTPVGAISKTIVLKIDGTQVYTTTTTVSNRQMSYTVAALSHGAHTIECYFTATVDSDTVESNHLYYEIVCVESGETEPIVASSYNTTTVDQYTTVNIPYIVYTPDSATSPVTITVNGTQAASLTVDRTQQTFTYRCDTAGTLTIVITSSIASKTLTLAVTAVDIDVEAETDSLVLYLSSAGRSNSEANPGSWRYGSYSATFTDFNYTSDGWQSDDDGITVLRVTGDARVTIPYQIFASDFRGTGKTIEVEFATKNVLDYNAVIFSCLSGGRGISLTAQTAALASEQSSISTNYKEDEHNRISFVVEKRSENRLVFVYINGIPSGVVQYPADDDFSQQTPVNISIGSNDCTIDLYTIRIYDNDLTHYQILNNWIADTQIGSELVERYNRNNVYDEYGQVVIDKLPTYLPYMILEAEELPQYKGDKKTITGSYVNPQSSAKSFTFSGCQINVQGTSSAPYARKNYDMQFKNGFVMASGSTAETYALASDVIPFNRFVLKADVASSEGANNVELVKLYNDLCPYDTPEMEADSRVRWGIYGFPIVVFWKNTSTNETSFLGKYNFNLPKRAPEPYGYETDGTMESWEFENNTSDRMLFKSDDFSDTYTDPETGESYPAWRNDFEARFPSDEWEDTTILQEFVSFVVSTDRDQATGDALDASVTYDGVTYTTDTAAYRLAKFKDEFPTYAELDSFIFYYIFTELFLMVDSRAKNLFIGFNGSTVTASGRSATRKATAQPYDMDTAIGTNNEGSLVFGYGLEDTDHLAGGANIFNGQDSVLWCNLRDAYRSEIVAMYQTLRSSGGLNYTAVETRYENHQSVWPEAIWNEDAWFKYIDPLISPDSGKEATAVYLPMMQGSKAEQRKWWMINRFKYTDSKWNAGDALAQVIQLRGYAKANITVTPYTDLYPTIKYASYLVQARATQGVATTLVCPLDTVNDTEIYIYSAPQIASVGDLSGLKVGFADFSMATRLQSIKLGDSSASYSNPNLETLTLGSNKLLRTLDARNCSALGTGDQKTVDLSGCEIIEYVYFDGTAITGVSLPNGGVLRTLHLPSTITSLTLRNQPFLTDLTVPSYGNITTLWLENVGSTIDEISILDTVPANARVRIVGLSVTSTTKSDFEDFLDLLDDMRGLDEHGDNTETAYVDGTVHVTGTLTGTEIAAYNARYPYITITADHTTCELYYYTYDGATLLYTETITDGGNGSYDGEPTRAATAANTFTFAGWSRYKNQYAADATATQNVSSNRSVYAAYTVSGQTYTVYFYNGSTLLETVTNVPYGGDATYSGETPTYTGTDPEDWEFAGWSPSGTGITGNTSCYAQYNYTAITDTITDSWEDIIDAIDDGTYATKYSVGDTKILDLGTEGKVCMQIAALDTDDLADGSGKAPITWISEQLLRTSHRMNPALETVYAYNTGASWTQTSNSYEWKSNNRYVASNTATLTMDVTAVTSGTLRLGYNAGTTTSSYVDYTIEVDGTTVVNTLVSSINYYDLTITSGTTYTIVVTVNCKSTSYSNQATFRLCDSNNAYTTSAVSSLVTLSNIVISDCSIRSLDHYTSSTGAIGGWEASEMRTYLTDTIKPLIPSTVRSAIKSVTKTQPAYSTAGSSFTQTTTDDVWIPSYSEMFGASSTYYGLYQNTNANRIKYLPGASSASLWWLRSARYSNGFYIVDSSGGNSSTDANAVLALPLSFCL